mmetsp:Transcript_23839/g.40130  ORF Transcript_23839/g.40130 Transcript_23839/m.40130 type:complete len:90 (-) Transcript_23839:1891-2160(-)
MTFWKSIIQDLGNLQHLRASNFGCLGIAGHRHFPIQPFEQMIRRHGPGMQTCGQSCTSPIADLSVAAECSEGFPTKSYLAKWKATEHEA